MSEKVTGTIGESQVNLDNAASEATLEKILKAMIAIGTRDKETLEKLSSLVKEKDSIAENVKKTKVELTELDIKAELLGATFAGVNAACDSLSKGLVKLTGVTSDLVSGSGKISGLFGEMGNWGGAIGLFGKTMQIAAQAQEEYLKTYRNLSDSGVTFSGSLTQMRLAASGMHMTMEEFTSFMKANSDTFRRMGGDVNSGAEIFKKMSKNMQDSNLGENLRSMGYTAGQINQGLADYISMTGGRTKQELSSIKNQKALQESAGAYLTELDRLAAITGKSREQQDKELKEKMQAADIEIMKSRMSVKERDAFTIALAKASAQFGQAGVDAVVAGVQGRAVTTEGGKLFLATNAKAFGLVQQYYGSALKDGADSQKMHDLEHQARLANIEATDRFSTVVISNAGAFKTQEDALRLAAKDKMAGLTTEKAMADQEKTIHKDRVTRSGSEAKTAADTEFTIQKLGETILQQLMPGLQALQPIILDIAKFLSNFAQMITANHYVFKGLKIVTELLIAGFIALKAHQAKEMMKDALLGPKGTSNNPMYVKIKDEPFGGGGSGGGSTSGKGGKGGKLGKLGKVGRVGGSLLGMVGGAALDYAGEKATESGHEKVGAGIDIASSAAQGASLGLMLGPMGAAVGGLLGGAYGLYKNWDTLTGKNDQPADEKTVEKVEEVKQDVDKNHQENLAATRENTQATNRQAKALEEANRHARANSVNRWA